MDEAKASKNPFNLSDLSFDEYRNQDVIEADDGAFFDALDEMVGIVPGTDETLEGEQQPIA
ncbi:hypothetical protein [Collinsella bouchesdurhonensis]|uniref:hypothetical protein n=1 Tax=Collinsella bouchesdurhonensis TaxID=1907654 RepID=UPI003F88AA8F